MKTFQHKFVEFIPSDIVEGVIYISVQYKTAVHLCVCGCGNKVVTPITPNDWEISFNGKTVSFNPSIGNWNFECKSHYFIKNNEVIYCHTWSDWEIKKNRLNDKKEKTKYLRIKKEKKWFFF